MFRIKLLSEALPILKIALTVTLCRAKSTPTHVDIIHGPQMNIFAKSLSVIALSAMALPALAQESGETTEGEAAPNPLALSMGRTEIKVGGVYLDDTFGDWELRCVKAEEGKKDPCQMYQLLSDDKGNQVAEINLFPLNDGSNAVAGATIVTPLETLLTQGLTLSIDGGSARKYPFSWCSKVGCFSRVGFSKDDVTAFKRGNQGVLTVVPVVAPDQKVQVTVSLTGFTAAFDAAEAKLAE